MDPSEMWDQMDDNMARCMRCPDFIVFVGADATIERHMDYHARLDRIENERALFVAMHRLVRNLRDAAGCALAAELQACASECDGGYPAGARPPWVPNLDGRAAPGWER